MSEASPATHTAPLSGWKYGSIGVPLPNTESKVRCLYINVNIKEKISTCIDKQILDEANH